MFLFRFNGLKKLTLNKLCCQRRAIRVICHVFLPGISQHCGILGCGIVSDTDMWEERTVSILRAERLGVKYHKPAQRRSPEDNAES
jgi:hypothetical protein